MTAPQPLWVKAAALEVAVDTLLDLIGELTDPAECSYDHDDHCQAHGLDERPCPHERAKAVLAIREEKRTDEH